MEKVVSLYKKEKPHVIDSQIIHHYLVIDGTRHHRHNYIHSTSINCSLLPHDGMQSHKSIQIYVTSGALYQST